MRLPPFDYVEPKSVSKASQLLDEGGTDAKIIAGGTDFVQAMKYRLKMPKLLIGLNRIPSLRQIRYTRYGGLTIGAMASLRNLAAHPSVQEKYPMLASAALSMGSVQLQAMGTVGGNLCQDNCCIYYSRSPMARAGLGPCIKLGGTVCHVVKNSNDCWATYCGDLAPALLALRATVKVVDRDRETRLPLGDIFSGNGANPHSLQPSQIITEVLLPPPPENFTGGVYLKMRMRKAIDYPLLGVAVSISLNGNSERFKDITIGLTAVDKAPRFLEASDSMKSENDLQKITEELSAAALKQANPIANTYGYSPKYRRQMVPVYVRQAIQQSRTIALKTEV